MNAAAAPLLAFTMCLGACGPGEVPTPKAQPGAGTQTPSAAAANAPPSGPASVGLWNLRQAAGGSTLAYQAPNAAAAILLMCPTGRRELLVNVPAFRPVGSEERLSFGSGAAVIALVADTKGDRGRGGVSGTGAIPDDLSALLGGAVSASYGSQTSGPHPAIPAELLGAFVASCQGGKAPPAIAGKATGGACNMQGNNRLAVQPLRAVGTEPFWAAAVEGRCVTYSHPEDQAGSRIWTRYTAGAGGGSWSGTHAGKPFTLRIRAAPGCSDGMSDRRYPLAADLLVGGEQRRGCAAPV